MNIPVWEEALREAGLSDKYADVLLGFKHRFNQGIPEHVVGSERWFTPENHLSEDKAREDIKNGIKQELKANRMFGPFKHKEVVFHFDFFRSNPLGDVVNGDGKIRPINDLLFPRNDPVIRSVNSFVDKKDFTTTWDNYNTVFKFFAKLEEKYELALFDWEKAYRQIPTHVSQWQYLLWKDFNGDLLLDTCITFGGVAGCGSFGRPADAWKNVMEFKFNQLEEVFQWVDDNLFIRTQGATVSMQSVVQVSAALGVKTNEKKFLEFSNEQKFINFVWNGRRKTVRLPDGKIEERIAQIQVTARKAGSDGRIQFYIGCNHPIQTWAPGHRVNR
jgi:hypothetical protein